MSNGTACTAYILFATYSTKFILSNHPSNCRKVRSLELPANICRGLLDSLCRVHKHSTCIVVYSEFTVNWSNHFLNKMVWYQPNKYHYQCLNTAISGNERNLITFIKSQKCEIRHYQWQPFWLLFNALTTIGHSLKVPFRPWAMFLLLLRANTGNFLLYFTSSPLSPLFSLFISFIPISPTGVGRWRWGLWELCGAQYSWWHCCLCLIHLHPGLDLKVRQ